MHIHDCSICIFSCIFVFFFSVFTGLVQLFFSSFAGSLLELNCSPGNLFF